ncbi:hypothetical protein GQ457_03G027770 [Hibiscus cannabinus]
MASFLDLCLLEIVVFKCLFIQFFSNDIGAFPFLQLLLSVVVIALVWGEGAPKSLRVCEKTVEGRVGGDLEIGKGTGAIV